MAIVDLPFATGFYVSRSLPNSNQTCRNLYPQSSSGLSNLLLVGTAGITELLTTGLVQQENRGSHVKNDIAYIINGTGLSRLDRTVLGTKETFSSTFLGTIPGSGRVSMADNGKQLIVLDTIGNGWIYDESAGTQFQKITDPDFTANGLPKFVVYMDGYFIITTDSKKFIVSSLNDGLSYNALDFGTAEADPDKIVAPIVFRNQLFIGGSETTEVFQNIGGSGFPFQRVQGFVMPTGVFSPFSIVQAGGTFLYIGGGSNDSPGIYAFSGNDMVKISTDAIDDILLPLSSEDIAGAFSVAYSQGGANFVLFTVKDRTLGYDFVSKAWHERCSRVVSNSVVVETNWRVSSLITAYNRVIVGDLHDGRIGILDLDTYDEYGENITREFSTIPFFNNNKAIFVPYIEITFEAGVGNDTENDPVVSMSRSLDGKIFKYPRTRRIGKTGEYDRRTIWRRNGRAGRFEVFKFSISDKVKVVIMKLTADIIGAA